MIKHIMPLIGYIHLYRSLLRFYDMPENEVKEMLYALNTANLDCFGYYHPDIAIIESGAATFIYRLEKSHNRPYRTEVQLYKALEVLEHSVERSLMTCYQREALQKLRCVMANLEYRFYKAYGREISDNSTVYADCAFHLVPKADEPSVPILDDWINLTTA